MDRLGVETAERAAAGDDAQGRSELTSRDPSTIGAHVSGCLLGGPFYLNSNLKA
jgi:hypothetical protein